MPVIFASVIFTIPSFVAGFTGGKDIKASGEKTASAVKSTMQSAGDMISGKALKKSFNEVKSMAPGMIPGGALIGDAAKKGAKAVGEGAKKFGEGAMAAGKVAAQGIGAAVGAATAKKTTTVVKEGRTETITKHNYRINLNVDDLSNPIRVIDFGCNVDKAEQVSNVLNVIIYRTQGDILNP
jgi:hypothetical protein